MKKGWEIKKLGDIVDKYNGLWKGKKPPFVKVAVIRNTNFSKDCKLRLQNIEYLDVEEKQYKTRKLFEGDIIIEKSGGSDKQPVGRPILFDIKHGEYSFSNFTSAIRVKEGLKIMPKFLQLCLYNHYLLGATFPLQSATTGIHNLDFKGYLELEVPVPSLLEQGRIVGVLDAAFAKIDALKENAQKNLENAKALFQQVLKQELTPKPNWQTKKLGEIALKKLSYGASVPSRNFDGEYRYIRITDIDEDGKLLNDLVSPAVCEEKHILHSGDLLLARTGGTIGKSYLYSPEDGKCIYAGYLIRVIVNQDIVLPEFVFFNTKTDRYWNFIKKSQKTAAQPNINAQQYSSFDIPYPSKDEQEGIVRKIKSIFTKQKQLEKCCQKTIAECDAFKQAVLRRAFNGEL